MRVIVQLNDRWRITDDGVQWILQHRQSRSTDRGTGWKGRSYCTQRGTLCRCIRDHRIDVEPQALHRLDALPPRYLTKQSGS